MCACMSNYDCYLIGSTCHKSKEIKVNDDYDHDHDEHFNHSAYVAISTSSLSFPLIHVLTLTNVAHFSGPKPIDQ